MVVYLPNNGEFTLVKNTCNTPRPLTSDAMSEVLNQLVRDAASACEACEKYL